MMEHSDKRYWWKDAKIYELYIDKFAKDVKDLTHNIDYFGILGVNTLHILPHYPSPMVDDGYDISDYRSVRSDLGTMEDFDEFLRAAHEKGLRIILDLVINHTSDQHPWFIEARSSKNNPKRDYYLWSDTGAEFENAYNAFPSIKSRNWIRNEQTADHYFATFYPAQPDLNWDNPAIFDEMMGIIEFWAAKGVDGFRVDAAPYMYKREVPNLYGSPETHRMLKKIRAALEKKFPEVILLAEADKDSRSYFGDGDECHMVYDFALMQRMWLTLMNGDMAAVGRVVDESRDIPSTCQWATFLRNHDEIYLFAISEDNLETLRKFLDPSGTYLFGKYPAVRVGNVFNGDKDKILAAFKMLYSQPGAPIMYYGDEIGMRNLDPVQGIQDARKYVRGNFDWPEAAKQMKDPTSIFSATAALIHGTVLVPEPSVPPVAA